MPVVLMQCSGLGNAMNAFGSLAVPYGLAFPVIISMRGTLGERNPVQVPMGRAAVDMLALVGIQAFPLHRRENIGAMVRGVFALARDAREVAAIMLEPELDL
jgi:sulfopyruvate decarboxylase TPP-binding subunit